MISRRETQKAKQTNGDRHLHRWLTLAVLVAVLCYGLSGCGLLDILKPQPKQTWWHVYFTDPSLTTNPIQQTLISYINKAKRSIHIAAFEFDLTPVADALAAAKSRGVDVEWVTDNEHGLDADKEPGHGQFALLKRSRIPVKDDGRGDLMHNKFIIFDNQIVWTGSTNLTKNGTQKNNNNVIVFESPQLAAIYEREFAEMWAGQFGPKSPSTVALQQVTLNGTPIQALFAPEDKVASQILPLLQGARKSIRFMAFSFTHDQLGEAVLSRAKAGVDVKGIFETQGSETQYSQLRPLFCAKVPVRQDTNPSAFHHKVFVIDDRTTISGSFNFSNNADKGNDENLVIVTNSEIAAQYLKEFERRWAESRVPAAAKMKCQ